jgi:two-component system nitrate/nitrite response regulator NarL
MARSEPFGNDPRIRVLIVADVRLYRESLAARLEARNHVSVAGTAATRLDALQRIDELDPEIVLVDAAMVDGLELMRDLRRERPVTKIVALAVEDAASDIIKCARAGAAGYVTADASLEDLVLAIECSAREELVCPPRIAAMLFRRMSEDGDTAMPVTSQLAKALSVREGQVLDLIRQGLSNKEIGQRLNIAEPTVKNHVHHLLEKLEVTTRAQAAAKIETVGGRRRAKTASDRAS